MPIEAAVASSEILLLARREEEIALIREATNCHRINVVAECPDVVSFLRQQGRYANASRPDLILLDMDLSKTEECEVLTEIKKSPEFKRIPVVVIASSERYEDVFQAYDLHANAYICKPTDRTELVRVLRTTLQFWLTLVRLPRE